MLVILIAQSSWLAIHMASNPLPLGSRLTITVLEIKQQSTWQVIHMASNPQGQQYTVLAIHRAINPQGQQSTGLAIHRASNPHGNQFIGLAIHRVRNSQDTMNQLIAAKFLQHRSESCGLQAWRYVNLDSLFIIFNQ